MRLAWVSWMCNTRCITASWATDLLLVALGSFAEAELAKDLLSLLSIPCSRNNALARVQ